MANTLDFAETSLLLFAKRSEEQGLAIRVRNTQRQALLRRGWITEVRVRRRKRWKLTEAGRDYVDALAVRKALAKLHPPEPIAGRFVQTAIGDFATGLANMAADIAKANKALRALNGDKG